MLAARRRLAILVALTVAAFTLPLVPAHALPLFSFSSTSLSFPSTVVGDSSAGIAVVVTNVSGAPQTVAMAGGAPGDANFSGVQACAGATLAAGASCQVTYAFTPQATGPHSTTTSFTINGESTGTITLSGTATPGFSITPTTFTFPTTVVGDVSAGQDVVVKNLASSPQVVTMAGGAPGDPNFGGVQACNGVTLPAGGTCVVTYTFEPQTSGPHASTTSFTINGQSSGTISMSGTATPNFSITPTTLDFPTTPVSGTSAPIDVVVTNLGTTPRLLSSVAGGAAGDANFGAVQACAGVTLNPGASCAFSYTFTPQTSGPHVATTSFSINGQSSGTISLSGTTDVFTITPTSLTFPSTAVGATSAGQDVLVTNRSSAPQTLTVSGGAPGDPNFGVTQDCAGATLAAGASCRFTYTFVPQTPGAHTVTTNFTVNGQDSGAITLAGTVPAASATPSPTASTSAVAVLGDTGSSVDLWAGLGAALAVVAGAALLLLRRRSTR